MLKIRLTRMGARKEPCYRVVVSDSRKRPDSRYVEVLGTYDPTTHPATVDLDCDRAGEWIRKGAHASATVRSLIEQQKAKARALPA